MANCPKCNKSVPFYKLLTYIRRTGIKCDHCETKSFISQKSLSWRYVCGVIAGIVAGFCSYSLHHSRLSSLALGFIVGGLFYWVIGWQYTILEIRE